MKKKKKISVKSKKSEYRKVYATYELNVFGGVLKCEIYDIEKANKIYYFIASLSE
jgi:hypothetical protein